MKSYPSSELRNVCDELVVDTEVAEDREDILQQMLERRLVLIHQSFLLESAFSRQLNYLNILTNILLG